MFHPFRSSSFRLPFVAFCVFVGFSTLSRLALFIQAGHRMTPDISLPGAFACGLFFDVVAGLFAAVPWLLYATVAPERFLKSTRGGFLTTALMLVFAYTMVFIGVSEWGFWDEFGARFNFIAVDYLIWTREVLGDVADSYPLGPILAGIGVPACGVVWWMCRRGIMKWAVAGGTGWKERGGWLLAGLALPASAAVLIDQSWLPAFANPYHGELAKNGCWSFVSAYGQMELSYDHWYPAMPQKKALASAKALLTTPDEQPAGPSPEDLRRVIRGRGAEHRWNVIVICMESMSAGYMAHAGGKENLTPNLDRLAGESLFFSNLFATGTRTARGMEAITLGLPPTPGQAVIQRPEGTNLRTTFGPFLDRDYDCGFFYGGDGGFDHMNRYFSTSGCRIMDVNEWEKKDTTFRTSWGACDEDLFNKVISEADKDHARGKPFHYFCMTSSNHRPYDFPDGRIDMKSGTGRGAAVKYADWAVGKLIGDAATKPWFKETLFVFCSDHYGSSAGKSELDVTQFHIPAMIYNPGLVPARRYSKLCSQIDIMPTVLGLLNWNHETLGFGHDLLSPGSAPLTERAFIGNYQKIAFLRGDYLVIFKPKRKSLLYFCDTATGRLIQLKDEGLDITHDAISYYQSASWLFGSGGLKSSFLNRRAGSR